MAFKGVPANSPRWGSETGGPSPGGPALCSFPARIRLSPSPRSRSSPEGLALRAGATQEDLLGADRGGGGVEALRAQASCGCRMCETVLGPQAGDSCKAPQRAGVSRGQRLQRRVLPGPHCRKSPQGLSGGGWMRRSAGAGSPSSRGSSMGRCREAGKWGWMGCGEEGAQFGSTWRLGNPSS